jgi:hypothetical protein
MRSLDLLTNKRHGVQLSNKLLDLKCCISFIKACRQAHLEHNWKLGSMGILPYISNAGDRCIELPSKGSCSESLKISSHVASSCCVQHCLSEPISQYSYFSPSWDYIKVMHLQCQESKLCSGFPFWGKNQIYAHWFFLSSDTQMAGLCRLRKWSGSSTTTLVPLSNSRPVFACSDTLGIWDCSSEQWVLFRKNWNPKRCAS